MEKKTNPLFRWLAVLVCCSLLLGLAAFADDEKKEEQAKKKTSLADLARGSKEDRQAESGRKYTNEDLKKAEGNITSSTDVPKTGTAPQPPGGQTGPDQESVDAKYYKEIVAQIQKIADLQRQRDVQRLEYNRLRTLYANSPSGPYQNREVKPKLDASYNQWQELEKEIEQGKKDLAALKEAARKNGVLPATIRRAEEDGQKMPEPDVPPAIR